MIYNLIDVNFVDDGRNEYWLKPIKRALIKILQ